MILYFWAGQSGVWLVLLVVFFLIQCPLLARLLVTYPMALWMTMGVILLSLWLPMFWGLLQGKQSFLWFGLSMMASGVGRLGGAALLVLLFGCYAAGMMTGVLLGLLAAASVAIWNTRDLWRGHALPFDWRKLLGQVIPLLLGFAAFQFLFTADTMFVASYFKGDQTAPYVGAGTMSRALMWLVGPLAAVMFPKLVHSSAKGQKSNLMRMVLLGTAILAAGGAIGLMVLGPWVIKLVYNQSYVEIATAVLPWYAGGLRVRDLGDTQLLPSLLRPAQRDSQRPSDGTIGKSESCAAGIDDRGIETRTSGIRSYQPCAARHLRLVYLAESGIARSPSGFGELIADLRASDFAPQASHFGAAPARVTAALHEASGKPTLPAGRAGATNCSSRRGPARWHEGHGGRTGVCRSGSGAAPRPVTSGSRSRNPPPPDA